MPSAPRINWMFTTEKARAKPAPRVRATAKESKPVCRGTRLMPQAAFNFRFSSDELDEALEAAPAFLAAAVAALRLRPSGCATRIIASSYLASHAWCAAAHRPIRITCALRKSARSGARSAMSLPCRCVGRIIVRSIGTVTRPHGGPELVSSLCRWPSRYGGKHTRLGLWWTAGLVRTR